MPLRKTEFTELEQLNDALKNFTINESSVFITVSLKPFLYKESFRNQFSTTQTELKQFIECVSTDCIIVTEATKKNNVHYHIVANTTHQPDTIDDFARNFKKLGNTFTSKCNDKTKMSQSEISKETYFHSDEIQVALRNYMIKDFEHSEDLLNGLYQTDYMAPSFRYTAFQRPPKKLKKFIFEKSDNVKDCDDIFLTWENPAKKRFIIGSQAHKEYLAKISETTVTKSDYTPQTNLPSDIDKCIDISDDEGDWTNNENSSIKAVINLLSSNCCN